MIGELEALPISQVKLESFEIAKQINPDKLQISKKDIRKERRRILSSVYQGRDGNLCRAILKQAISSVPFVEKDSSKKYLVEEIKKGEPDQILENHREESKRVDIALVPSQI
jgi:glutamate mutase epsilon subunit